MKKNATTGSGLGFTLIELLTVIAIIGILAGLLLPTLAAARGKAREAKCLSDQRQLAVAWFLYTDDNADFVAANGYLYGPELSNPMWVQGYYNIKNFPSDSTNTSLLLDPKYAQFAPYIREIKLYRCPADTSKKKIGGGWFERPRSRGMNWQLGWRPYPDRSPSGRVILKLSQASSISSLLLLGDLNEDSLCWPFFGILSTEAFHMLPGIQHRKGAGLSFADGRALIRRWKDPRTRDPRLPQDTWHEHLHPSPRNPDLQYLQRIGRGEY